MTTEYLESHSHNRAVIKRDTSIFDRYSHYVPMSGKLLDWGCNHAPSATLLKMLRGDSVEIHGCDVHGERYEAFYRFSDLRYTQLSHPYQLPYEDNSFDAVIGTAALEHVPNDSRSLEELYRIIKPNGFFIMSTLPNRYSYTECINRALKRPAHRRLYTLKEAKKMFLHHGFIPVESGYHQVWPSLCALGGLFDSRKAQAIAEFMSAQNAITERLWPIRCIASNIFVVGQKVLSP